MRETGAKQLAPSRLEHLAFCSSHLEGIVLQESSPRAER